MQSSHACIKKTDPDRCCLQAFSDRTRSAAVHEALYARRDLRDEKLDCRTALSSTDINISLGVTFYCLNHLRYIGSALAYKDDSRK